MTQMSEELRQTIADDGYDEDAVRAWSDYTGEDVTEWDAPTRDAFSDAFQGTWDSFREYIEETCSENGLANFSGDILTPEQVQSFFSYIDWDQVEVDWDCSGEWFTADAGGSVYVFHSI